MPFLTQTIQRAGPILPFVVGVSQQREQALKASGLPVPPKFQIQGLVDTGASATCIDPGVVRQLGLTPTGQVSIITPSTGATPHSCLTYDICLILLGPSLSLGLGVLPVSEAQLAHQGFQALIGRDVLRRCLLVYDGNKNTFTLAF